jgi:hypothetical protein
MGSEGGYRQQTDSSSKAPLQALVYAQPAAAAFTVGCTWDNLDAVLQDVPRTTGALHPVQCQSGVRVVQH